MAKGSSSRYTVKVEENNAAKRRYNSIKGSKVSNAVTVDKSGLRKSESEDSLKKKIITRSLSTRKWERTKKQIPPTPIVKRKLAIDENQQTPSHLRRSERGKKQLPSASSGLKKSGRGSNSSDIKHRQERKEKRVKVLKLGTAKFGTSSENNMEMGQVKGKRMDARAFQSLFKKQRREVILQDHREEQNQIKLSNSGISCPVGAIDRGNDNINVREELETGNNDGRASEGVLRRSNYVSKCMFEVIDDNNVAEFSHPSQKHILGDEASEHGDGNGDRLCQSHNSTYDSSEAMCKQTTNEHERSHLNFSEKDIQIAACIAMNSPRNDSSGDKIDSVKNWEIQPLKRKRKDGDPYSDDSEVVGRTIDCSSTAEISSPSPSFCLQSCPVEICFKRQRFAEYWVPVQISNVQLEQYCSILLLNSTSLCSSSRNDHVGALGDILISTLKYFCGYDQNLQSISSSTSHTLLLWGASHLFDNLEKFHGSNISALTTLTSVKESLLLDVVRDLVSILPKNDESSDPYELRIMVKTQQVEGSYHTSHPLVGELKISQTQDLPHLFWSKLLLAKHPQWIFSSVLYQRNRKRAQCQLNHELPQESDLESDRVVKRHKKVSTGYISRTSLKVRLEDESTGREREDSPEGPEIMTLCSPWSKSVPGILEDDLVELDEGKELCGTQTSFYHHLKPGILNLCQILQLSENVKHVVAKLFVYVVDNHNFSHETSTFLQAFQLSLCWTAAYWLNYKISHKESMALAKEKLNFDCKREEADIVYSKLRCLRYLFLSNLAEKKVAKAPVASEISFVGDRQNLPATTKLESNIVRLELEDLLQNQNNKQVGLLPEMDSKFVHRDILKSVKLIKKKCGKQLSKLIKKLYKEKDEVKRNSEEVILQIEKNYRVESAVIRYLHGKSFMGTTKFKILEKKFAKKIEDQKSQMEISLKVLEAGHLAARNKVKEKEAHLVEELKSWAQGELLNKQSPNKASHKNSQCVSILHAGEEFPNKFVENLQELREKNSETIPDKAVECSGNVNTDPRRHFIDPCVDFEVGDLCKKASTAEVEDPDKIISASDIPENVVTLNSCSAEEDCNVQFCLSDGGHKNSQYVSNPHSGEEFPSKFVENLEELREKKSEDSETIPDKDVECSRNVNVDHCRSFTDPSNDVNLGALCEEASTAEVEELDKINNSSSDVLENGVSLYSCSVLENSGVATACCVSDGDGPLELPGPAFTNDSVKNLISLQPPIAAALTFNGDSCLPDKDVSCQQLGIDVLSKASDGVLIPTLPVYEVNGASTSMPDKELLQELSESICVSVSPDRMPINQENNPREAAPIILNEEIPVEVSLSTPENLPTFEDQNSIDVTVTMPDEEIIPETLQSASDLVAANSNRDSVNGMDLSVSDYGLEINQQDTLSNVNDHIILSTEMSPVNLLAVSTSGTTSTPGTPVPSNQGQIILPSSYRESLFPETLFHYAEASSSCLDSSQQTSVNFVAQPSSSLDPLQNELDRIRKETEDFIKESREKKVQLQSDFEKEMEEVFAQIRSKYNSKLQDAEADFVLKRKVLDRNYYKVLMNKRLAYAFRSKSIDSRLDGARRFQQDVISTVQHRHPPQQNAPRPPLPVQIPTTSPSSNLPASSFQPILFAPNPHISPVTNRSALPNRLPFISSVSSSAANLQVGGAIRSPGPHLQPFGPPPRISPFLPRHSPTLQVAGNCFSSYSQLQSQLPLPSNHPNTCSGAPELNGLMNLPTPNTSISALGLFRDVNRSAGVDLPNSADFCSNFIASFTMPASATVNTQVNLGDGGGPDVVCLSDDE